ncbi:MAG TPA: anti-sigma factor [Terriglobales bacterium]|nr:anti-sigma factor [Terriglobales bacterium]
MCDSWKLKLDTYVDGELPIDEMRAFDTHVKTCPSCAAEALARVQMKRSIQSAGMRFTPSAEFRKRVQQRVTTKKPRSFRFAWAVAGALAIVLLVGIGITYRRQEQLRAQQIYTEVADLHVATLASATPVDVISTDRHTVKPWFQGKIPFTFDLPELANSEFTLVGGRMAYLEHTPGAQLIYQVRKHRISVFIFEDAPLRGVPAKFTRELAFNEETWTQGGLRYFVIGDASAGDISNLAKLFKSTT